MKNFTTYAFALLLTLSSYFASGNTTFYSKDFGTGIPAGWKNLDSAGQGLIWTYTTTGDPIIESFATVLNPTPTCTANNGYMIFDSDSAFGVAGDGWLVTDSINCVGRSNVHLKFNEYFAQYQTSTGTVLISTDSVHWTAVHSADLDSGVAMNGGVSADPNAVDIDISALADGHSTVYVAFHYVGNTEYFWMIDDVSLYEVLTTDGGVMAIDTPMTSCGLNNTTNIVVTIKNYGADTLSNFPLHYVLNGGSPVLDSCHSSIAPGGTLMFTFATQGVLLPGLNTVKSYTTIAGDVNSSNDADSVIIYAGPHPVINALTYTDGFETADDVLGWLALDANHSGTTWAIATAQPHSGLKYANLNETNADDWFFSDCIALEHTPVDSLYQLTFFYRTFSNSYNANMEVKLFASQDTSLPVTTIVPMTTVTYSTNAYTQSTTLFTMAGPGIYYLGFHGKGAGLPTSLEIDDINLQLVKIPVDGGVIAVDTPMTNCTPVLSTNVTVTIKNFSADTLANNNNVFPVSYKVNGGTAVTESINTAIAPGGTLVHTFATPAALVLGANTIQTYTAVRSDVNTANDTMSTVIYNGPHNVFFGNAYTDGFEATVDTIGWLAIDGNHSGTTWGIGTAQPHTGTKYAKLSEANANDWYFSPCLAMEQTVDSVYELDFWYRTDSANHKATMEVRLFASQDTLSPAVVSIVPYTSVTNSGSYNHVTAQVFPMTTTGIYYLGFHGVGVSGFATSLEIDDIHLQLIGDVGVNQLSAKNANVVLYPNPNTGIFYLANLKSFKGTVQVNVFDMMGKAVYNQTVNDDRAAIDLSSQPAGVYMVRLNSPTDVVTKMVTITR